MLCIKMLSGIMFLSISQIERQAHCRKKQGRKGNTNFIIMFWDSQTVEPHMIIHAAISQIMVKKGREEKKNQIPFGLFTQKEPHKRNTVSLSLHVQKHSAKHGRVLKLLGLLHFNNMLVPELSKIKNTA